MVSITRELSVRAVILGIVLGFIFAVGNAYLGLKVGLTVSASIPAAVMSMAILRILPPAGTIQENNIVQTIASAGEALAAGVIFTIPALTFLGYPASWWQVFALSLLGGVLGIMMMIPLRHQLIVAEHNTLPYPEGTACAKILAARTGSRHKAALSFYGMLVGAIDKVLMGIVHLFREVLSWTGGRIFTVTLDTTPALLGVGYLIGARYALVMFAGGALAWWVLIPLISTFGWDSLIYPDRLAIHEMEPNQVWADYVRYIGTGAMAMGGLISLLRLLPVLYRSLRGHFGTLIRDAMHPPAIERTKRDLPFLWVLLTTVAALALLYVLPGLTFNWLSIVMILITAFLFVGLTSVTVGIVGASSNPVSGMMILTLLVVSLVFLGLGWTAGIYLVMAISIGTVVGVAIAIAADTSQDLKTGYLVKATPLYQQVGMLIGIVVPALIMGYVLRLLHAGYGFGTDELPAPQATLMAVVVKGVMEKSLPFILILTGVVIGLIVELMRIRALPFALGIYLPVSTTTSIAIGGITAHLVKRFGRHPEARDQGVLFSSGLVAGDALMGVLIALLTVIGLLRPSTTALLPSWVSIIVYALVVALLGWMALHRTPKK